MDLDLQKQRVKNAFQSIRNNIAQAKGLRVTAQREINSVLNQLDDLEEKALKALGRERSK